METLISKITHMRKLFFILPLFVVAAACTPKSSYNSGTPSQPLVPVVPGNYWIYQDSVFNQNNLGVFENTYRDSMYVTSTSAELTGTNGVVVFYQLADTGGWFGDSFMGLDPSNTVLYGLDSLNGTAYIEFGTSSQDGASLGSDVDNTTNPACPVTYTLYGYATTTVINGHTCLKNVQTTVNCNTFTLEQINTYVAPGVGVVRIEDYEADSTLTHLNLSFTQTLTATYNVQQ